VRYEKSFLVAMLVVLAGFVRPVGASLVDDVEISEWAYIGGAGINDDLAIVVIDYDTRSLGNEYAFGVYFVDSGDVTGMDLLSELSADTSLELAVDDYGFGLFVSGINYDGRDGEYIWPDWWSYWTSSDGESWTSSSVGACDRLVQHGQWDGWSAADELFTEPPYSQAPNVPIPEPMSAAFVILGGFVVSRARRKG